MQKAQENFMYGMNVTSPKESWINHNSSCSHGIENSQPLKPKTMIDYQGTVKDLLQGCTFTKDRYDQILSILQSSHSKGNVNESNAVNYAGSCALSTKSIITNVFHTLEFKYNILLASKITNELGCSITFILLVCIPEALQ